LRCYKHNEVLHCYTATNVVSLHLYLCVKCVRDINLDFNYVIRHGKYIRKKAWYKAINDYCISQVL